MNEPTEAKRKKKEASGESVDRVHVVRKGAISASIWRRQSQNGFGYYEFSLSRSWSSASSQRQGYSRNFFANNQADLLEVFEKAARWILEKQESESNPSPEVAIANNRSWFLATDDRVAARLASELSTSVVNTAQLVKMWADHSSPNTATLRQIIRNVQTYARFVPRKDSVESEWWRRHS